MKDVDFQGYEPCACFSARKTARLLTQHYDKYLRPTGLRATQYTLLFALTLFGQAVSLNQLSEVLGMERTTLTRNLQVMEKEGHISINSGKDKRTRLISLTKRGKEAFETAYPYWKKAQDSVAKHLSPNMLQSFAQTAAKIK
jgi:DNA-binding MarR family transcriptional regulator